MDAPELITLVNELLDDHSKLFNNLFPWGFKKPALNDEEYSLDLRQRVIMAVRTAEHENAAAASAGVQTSLEWSREVYGDD